MTRPLVVIGVPCYGTVAPELLEDWMRWAFHLGRRMPDLDFHIAIVTKKEQFRARNLMVEAAQTAGADYLLMMDDDMIINTWQTVGRSDAYDFLATLIRHDKDLCGVRYYQRQGGCHAVLMRGEPGTHGYRYLREDEITHGLQEVDVAGGGCLLIKMRVFAKIPMPYFEPEFEYGTDVQVCRKAQACGFQVWADTSIELGHIREERTIVTNRNRAQFATTDTLPGEVKRDFDASGLYTQLEADAATYTGYRDLAEMTRHAGDFLAQRPHAGGSDPAWYRLYPKERVARQVWFNTTSPHKRDFTQFILASIDHTKRQTVLDFGCGIGIAAFFLAEKGHAVTALDLAGTGTLAFLRWRAQQHGVALTIQESPGGVPDLGAQQFDVIIAMDSIEHIEAWREVIPVLATHLREGGILFSNNGILDDVSHPEHYAIDNSEFIQRMAQAALLPINQITYLKRTTAATRQPAAARPKEDLVRA